MKTDQPSRQYLKDYQQPEFYITETRLDFLIEPGKTTVQSQLKMQRSEPGSSNPLQLDGMGLKLIDLQIDGEYLDVGDFEYDGTRLTVFEAPDHFVFSSSVEIHPEQNTRLSGLYQSNGTWCTQCEAEGFRYITFYLDRPDVMSVFTTVIRGDINLMPVMLSNGNLVDSGTEGSQHWHKWQDPFPKPSYLFALVAGDLACVSDRYSTASGRDVLLEIYTEAHNQDKCQHALQSLKKAMRWDEERFGLEYDLDQYMIVAVDDFNAGAMENKGLNVFNTRYVLASEQTATDADYLGIESVIAHEYFHNWTGNRITCRDWFQLSLKEGLTVFRDQQFSEDMTSAAIERINQVRFLRRIQFAEDASPMAHPVRPGSYIEINNFYTPTVYEKGAEVVRMYQTLLGQDGFRKGMDLYFQRHDGAAVTTDDFRNAMADANATDLSLFQRWYDQSGTPEVHISRIYDAERRHLKLWIRQLPGHTQGEENLPFYIPIKLSVLGCEGKPYYLNQNGDTEVTLVLAEQEQSFEFEDIPEFPLLSIFRGFSAPVIVQSDLTDDELVRLIALDNDPFNQWDAAQQYLMRLLTLQITEPDTTAEVVPQVLVDSFNHLLTASVADDALVAEILTLPDAETLIERLAPVDVHRVDQVLERFSRQLALALEQALLDTYQRCQAALPIPYRFDAATTGTRRLKNVCLAHLQWLERNDYQQLAEQQYWNADNMTDQFAALSALKSRPSQNRENLYQDFYQRWKSTPLVLNKWFSLQSICSNDQPLAHIQLLLAHENFSLANPNRARSVLGVFTQNIRAFHANDGSGYRLLADHIIRLDSNNPQLAARLAKPLMGWKKLLQPHSALMRAETQRILEVPGLSADVYELMNSSLSQE